MARDYKPRPQYNKKTGRKGSKPARVATWQWFLVIALVFSFVAFLAYIRLTGSKQPESTSVAATETEKKNAKTSAQKTEAGKEKPAEPKGPHFDFYTVLPDKEVVVPEHEIKTRSREERVGKAKDSKYIMQAGSYAAFKEADQLRAKLALMGIESKVEKAKVGDSVSYRVKMGPYTQIASVDAIKKRLKKSGIDALVTESGEMPTTTKPVIKQAAPAQPAAKPAQPQATPTVKQAQSQTAIAGKVPATKAIQPQVTTTGQTPTRKPAQPPAATAAKTTTKSAQATAATGKPPVGNNVPNQPDTGATVITQPYR